MSSDLGQHGQSVEWNSLTGTQKRTCLKSKIWGLPVDFVFGAIAGRAPTMDES